MHAPSSEPRRNTHTRSYSIPNDTVNSRKRKSSTTTVPHHLLSSSTNTHLLHLAAPAVVDLIRLNSPSLASFTPYSESIDSQGPAWGSLRAHMHVRSQSLSAIPTGAKGIGMPSPPGRLQLLSHWEVGSSTAACPVASPSTPSVESPCSSSPPSSPSMSIPSISRTHSTTASSSLPRTPPLPLTPLSAHCRVKKKKSRESMPGMGGRKRAPSLPVWPADQRRDYSRERIVRERAFSTSGSNTNTFKTTTTRSRSPVQSLAALEASSKLMRMAVTCAICGMSGRDFPRCPKCGDAWCSRACRMIARKEAGKDGAGDSVRGHGCRGTRTVSE